MPLRDSTVYDAYILRTGTELYKNYRATDRCVTLTIYAWKRVIRLRICIWRVIPSVNRHFKLLRNVAIEPTKMIMIIGKMARFGGFPDLFDCSGLSLLSRQYVWSFCRQSGVISPWRNTANKPTQISLFRQFTDNFFSPGYERKVHVSHFPFDQIGQVFKGLRLLTIDIVL